MLKGPFFSVVYCKYIGLSGILDTVAIWHLGNNRCSHQCATYSNGVSLYTILPVFDNQSRKVLIFRAGPIKLNPFPHNDTF